MLSHKSLIGAALCIASSIHQPWVEPACKRHKHHNKKPAPAWPVKKKARKAAQASRRANRK